jgi:hypothetical protein
MTMKDLLVIWSGLRNRKLPSIRKGADIVITEIDFTEDRVKVRSASGTINSRSFGELEKIWNKLRMDRIAHVDSVLGGSGSSRNQPETLYAALPFVEYTFIDKKKHLLLLDENTHEAGTIKKATAATVQEIQRKLSESLRSGAPELVLPVNNVKAATDNLERLTGKSGIAEAPGEYVYQLGPLQIRVVSEQSVEAAYRGRTLLRGFAPRYGSLGELVELGEQLLVLPPKRS